MVLPSTRCPLAPKIRAIGLMLQCLFTGNRPNSQDCAIFAAAKKHVKKEYFCVKPKRYPFWLIAQVLQMLLSFTMGGQSEALGKRVCSAAETVLWPEIDAASFQLGKRYPFLCCRHNASLRSAVPRLGVVLGMVGLLEPGLIFFGVSIVMLGSFILLIVLRAVLCIIGTMSQNRVQERHNPNHQYRDIEWPQYAILVPLFREAGSVPGLVAALNALDYPADKLTILFLTELADEPTRQALLAEPLHPGAQILTLPIGEPQTKPRALNVALARLSGEIVTIYDAEDRPHPNQLKSAALALELERGGAQLACVQAPLYAYNANASWLAGQWALEYDVHFGLILPALARLGVPIALGGTSNHFRGLM